MPNMTQSTARRAIDVVRGVNGTRVLSDPANQPDQANVDQLAQHVSSANAKDARLCRDDLEPCWLA